MSYRKTPLVNGEIYHIFNRSIAQTPIFHTKRNCDRFLKTIEYYHFSNPPIRFSYFMRSSPRRRQEILESLYLLNNLKVEIYAFALMPNHFHLLLKQNQDDGIRNFISLIQNSFAKYLNTITPRTGSVFQQVFKGVRIENESQFSHVARYIHLNPLTNYVIKSTKELPTYLLTSFPDYVSTEPRPFVNTEPLSKLFSSIDKFTQHTLDQVDYQRTLNQIEHLATE